MRTINDRRVNTFQALIPEDDDGGEGSCDLNEYLFLATYFCSLKYFLCGTEIKDNKFTDVRECYRERKHLVRINVGESNNNFDKEI